MGTKQWANAVLCLLIFLLIGYGLHRVVAAPDIVSLLNPGVAVSSRAAALGDKVVLERQQFEINPATKRVRAEFRLANGSGRPVWNVNIYCELRDGAGERQGGGRWVIYETLEPGSTGRYVVEDERYIPSAVDPDNIVCTIVDLASSGSAGAVHEEKSH